MRFINARELNVDTAGALRRARREDLVVTVRGKPRALLVGLDEDDLEDYVLAKLVEERMQSRPRDFDPRRALPLDDALLALEKRRARRVRR